ncbi:MAG: ParA family protein, partial [Butyrivibrio sp.]|nr:ParA family protein [Butyrivibrio sp.]
YSFIASSKELSKAERQFVDYDDIFLLKDVIDAVGDEYDFVLIDNGPSRSILLTMSYVAADYIISPTDCDDGSIDGIKEVYADLQEIRAKKRPISKAKLLGILLTKYERTIMHQEAENTIEEIANETDDKPFVMTIRKAITASESKSARESMQEYQHNSNPAADYRAVAKMIVKKTGVK